eukprot:TRINITY_DN47458_c0_g1_i1.p1 TRINITY_DN47458_c0_g1~~TRINITY_DN47458_c0_g1_i1.p1  ORF type:complete len:199 (+),score=62.72 TRINITY_DN47458_c0_g1_i1:84-599(+)
MDALQAAPHCASNPQQLAANDGWGERIADGIYMINRHKPRALPEGVAGPRDPTRIPDEIKRLRNVVAHLERSNGELRAALAEEPDEEIYREAISDNQASLALRRADIERLEQELRDLGYGRLVGDAGDLDARAASEPDDGSDNDTAAAAVAPAPQPASEAPPASGADGIYL